MSYFTESNSENAVIGRLGDCEDDRFRAVMESAIRHLHAFVKEVEPTTEEWFQAIEFLTATGQICDDKRQEWMLASDTLGVSMLVDAINHRRPGGATENTVLGPFYVENAPKRAMGESIALQEQGEPCLVSGVVMDEAGAPIEGAIIEVWQTNDDGFYDVQQPDEQPAFNLRGLFETGADGAYSFRTVKPVSYPIPSDGPVGKMLERMGRHPMRPAHIHFMVTAPGYEKLITHIFVQGDEYIESDAVFGVKEALIVDFTRADDDWAAEFPIRLKAA